MAVIDPRAAARALASWRTHFPHASVRPEQETMIEHARAVWSSGQKHVVLDAGTGCGKSAVAVCITRCVSSAGLGTATVLTSQRILQEQYERSYPACSSVWSSSHYPCGHERGLTCGQGKRLAVYMQSGAPMRGCDGCPYAAAREKFSASSAGVANYAYHLACSAYAPDSLPDRSLFVYDEAHNIERELSAFSGVRSTLKEQNKLACKTLVGCPSVSKARAWLQSELKPALEREIEKLRASAAAAVRHGRSLRSIAPRLDAADRTVCAVNRILEKDPSNLVVHGDAESLQITPLDVSDIGREMLFGDERITLSMSATIVDPVEWSRSSGAECSSRDFVHAPCPFPVANRRIVYSPVGKMSSRDIDATIPLLVDAVSRVLEKHPNEKGIVHAGSFKVARAIFEGCKSDRLLMHKQGGEERSHTLERHALSEKPTVLLTPSMIEGIDLIDDLSRFQVIAKVPFANLGDPLVLARKRACDRWYKLEAARCLMQAHGRSVRSADDWAVTYVFDSCFGDFIAQNSDLFSYEFIEAIEVQSS